MLAQRNSTVVSKRHRRSSPLTDETGVCGERALRIISEIVTGRFELARTPTNTADAA